MELILTYYEYIPGTLWWPLLLKGPTPQNKAKHPIKTRVPIWVPGIYIYIIYIFIHLPKFFNGVRISASYSQIWSPFSLQKIGSRWHVVKIQSQGVAKSGRPQCMLRWRARGLMGNSLESSCIFLGGGNSKIFYVHPWNWGKIPILTNIFQMGWNHQPVFAFLLYLVLFSFLFWFSLWLNLEIYSTVSLDFHWKVLCFFVKFLGVSFWREKFWISIRKCWLMRSKVSHTKKTPGWLGYRGDWVYYLIIIWGLW